MRAESTLNPPSAAIQETNTTRLSVSVRATAAYGGRPQARQLRRNRQNGLRNNAQFQRQVPLLAFVHQVFTPDFL